LITKPRVVLRYSKARINKIMFAAANEGYYIYVRNLPMKYIAKERAFWKENRMIANKERFASAFRFVRN